MTTAQDLLRTLRSCAPLRVRDLTIPSAVWRCPTRHRGRRGPSPLLLDVALAGEFPLRRRGHLSGDRDPLPVSRDEVLALCSRVATDQHGGHLLLLDFAVPPSNEAQAESSG